MANSRASSQVAKAVKNGLIPHISTQHCVDCGLKASDYDHRDYNKPLEVEPVCRSCNLKRGPAKGEHDFIKSVNMEDNIHELLCEISDYRRKNGNLIKTNKDIIADLIMAEVIKIKHKMKREQAKNE